MVRQGRNPKMAMTKDQVSGTSDCFQAPAPWALEPIRFRTGHKKPTEGTHRITRWKYRRIHLVMRKNPARRSLAHFIQVLMQSPPRTCDVERGSTLSTQGDPSRGVRIQEAGRARRSGERRVEPTWDVTVKTLLSVVMESDECGFWAVPLTRLIRRKDRPIRMQALECG